MAWVERCKTYQPDIVVLDMGDSLHVQVVLQGQMALKANAVHARMIARSTSVQSFTCRNCLQMQKVRYCLIRV